MTYLDLIKDQNFGLVGKFLNFLSELNYTDEQMCGFVDRLFKDMEENTQTWLTELLPIFYGKRTNEVVELLNKQIEVPYEEAPQ